LRRTDVKASSGVTTFLFTDIEGSTRLWDREHERMQIALARTACSRIACGLS
jgi:class 3 adenylate cyclase